MGRGERERGRERDLLVSDSGLGYTDNQHTAERQSVNLKMVLQAISANSGIYMGWK
jgi:hypothetical protein